MACGCCDLRLIRCGDVVAQLVFCPTKRNAKAAATLLAEELQVRQGRLLHGLNSWVLALECGQCQPRAFVLSCILNMCVGCDYAIGTLLIRL